MDNELAATLGKQQAKIYWLHDAEDFETLVKTVSQIYQELGYSTATSDQAGTLIKEAYQLADGAQLARETGQSTEELNYYAKAQTKLESAAKLLDFPLAAAHHQVQWWFHFRHKNILKALWHLQQQHAMSSNVMHSVAVLRMTYCLLQVGLGHNQRDLAKCETYATRYWKILLTVSPQGIPYLG